jgi:hypothetical protein
MPGVKFAFHLLAALGHTRRGKKDHQPKARLYPIFPFVSWK